MCATYQAKRARQTRPNVHDKGACGIGEFCRDKEFSVTTDLNNDEIKKKDPMGFGSS